MTNLLQERDQVETAPDFADHYEPTPSDWECYRLHLEAEERAEMCDRTEELERHRRAQFDRARSGVCVIRGIAAALESGGLEPVSRQLLDAARDMMAVLNQYA